MRSLILNGEEPAIGSFSINMTPYIFHIGRTTIYYYKTQTYSVFGIGYDTFCDVLYPLEKSDDRPGGIPPDGKGWHLEFLGIPYDYIPTAVMIPN